MPSSDPHRPGHSRIRVPAEIVYAILREDFEGETPESVALLSLYMDMSSGRKSEMAGYAKLWKWTRAKVRWRLTRMTAKVKGWIAEDEYMNNESAHEHAHQGRPEGKQARRPRPASSLRENPLLLMEEPHEMIQRRRDEQCAISFDLQAYCNDWELGADEFAHFHAEMQDPEALFRPYWLEHAAEHPAVWMFTKMYPKVMLPAESADWIVKQVCTWDKVWVWSTITLVRFVANGWRGNWAYNLLNRFEKDYEYAAANGILWGFRSAPGAVHRGAVGIDGRERKTYSSRGDQDAVSDREPAQVASNDHGVLRGAHQLPRPQKSSRLTDDEWYGTGAGAD